MELEPGVEGLIHVSEMSWTKKNTHPGKIVSTSQQVEVQILEVDPQKRRISLGLKQVQDNPWEAFLSTHPKGAVVEGPIRNITEFGLFVGLDGGVDGMVHLSDLDWNKAGDEAIKAYKKGDNIKAVVLDVDPAKERISLGIKQVGGDPMESVGTLKKGSQVTCEVVAVQDNGIEVKLVDTDMTAFIKRSDLSRDRSEQRPERFNVGDKVDAAITTSTRTAAASRSRSRRWKSPKRSRLSLSTGLPTAAPRSATSSRPPSRRRKAATTEPASADNASDWIM